MAGRAKMPTANLPNNPLFLWWPSSWELAIFASFPRELFSLTLSYGNFMTIFVFTREYEGMFVEVANFEDGHEREDGHQE